MKSKNVILIGFMGVGKTTVGLELANALGIRLMDMDTIIQKQQNMSISDIFLDFGENYFRNLESDLCFELASKSNIVISTGGGIIEKSQNLELLKKTGKVVYLRATFEEVYCKLKLDISRPILNVPNKDEKIQELLSKRSPIYESFADFTVDIKDKSPFFLAQEIKKMIK